MNQRRSFFHSLGAIFSAVLFPWRQHPQTRLRRGWKREEYKIADMTPLGDEDVMCMVTWIYKKDPKDGDASEEALS